MDDQHSPRRTGAQKRGQGTLKKTIRRAFEFFPWFFAEVDGEWTRFGKLLAGVFLVSTFIILIPVWLPVRLLGVWCGFFKGGILPHTWE